MNFKLTAIFTAAVLCAAAASSCGKDKDSSSDVILDINTTTSETTTVTTGEADGETTTTTAASSTTGKKDDKKTTTTTAKKAETATTKAGDETEIVTEVPDNDPDEDPDEPLYIPDEPDEEPDLPEIIDSSSSGETFSTADIDQPISVFISALGGSFMQSEAEACIPKGDAGDVLFVYEYPDIKFECFSSGGTHYVYDIVITGGNYATDKGIKVGSSRADVTAAYSGLDEYNSDLIASGGSSEIYFVMSGDTVSEIQINSL